MLEQRQVRAPDAERRSASVRGAVYLVSVDQATDYICRKWGVGRAELKYTVEAPGARAVSAGTL